MSAPETAIDTATPAAPATRFVVFLNHLPVEILPPAATATEAAQRCHALREARRNGRAWFPFCHYHFLTVPEAAL